MGGGEGGRLDLGMSYGSQSFSVHPSFIVAPIIVGGSAFVPCLIILFSSDERGLLGEKKIGCRQIYILES